MYMQEVYVHTIVKKLIKERKQGYVRSILSFISIMNHGNEISRGVHEVLTYVWID